MRKIFRFFKMYLRLIVLDFNLRKNGVPRMFNEYVEKYEHISVKYYESFEAKRLNYEITNTLKGIENVCVFYPRNARCIHKSFLAYRILKEKYGINLKLVIGVCHFPFEAHAWVMQDRISIYDDEQDLVRYKVILDSSNLERGGR